MADRKISDLTALTAPAAGDYLPIVDISEVAAASKNKRITIEELFRGVPDGTAAAPAIAPESDPNTGIYSPGADQLSIATNGTERLRVDAAGQIEAVSLGTAAAPTFSFTGDPNTGIYSPGADQLAISTNGTGRLFVDASGNVATGTSFLSGKPTNADRVNYVGRGYSDTNIPALGLALYRSGTGEHGHLFWSGQSTGGNPRVLGSIRMEQTVATVANGGGDLIFNTNPGTAEQPAERARITSDGKLGLGTSSPGELLHVAGGNIRLTGTAGVAQTAFREINFNNLSTTANPGVKIVATTGASTSVHELGFYTTNNNAATVTEKLRITGAGNVGIGTTSPGGRFHVALGTSYGIGTGSNWDNNTAVFGGSSNTSGALGIAYNDTDGTTLASIVPGVAWKPIRFLADGHIFGESTSEYMRIDGSGRLLVGTSSARTVSPSANASGGVTTNALIEAGIITNLAIVSNSPSTDQYASALVLGRTRGSSVGSNTVVQNGDVLGTIAFMGADGTDLDNRAATIFAAVDGTPGADDMPGRLVFSTTADGAASPTERMRITSAGVLQIADAGNITVGTTTGTKIGTATTQKLGFYNATPVVQPTAVADATDAASVITQLNALLTRMRNLGLIAT